MKFLTPFRVCGMVYREGGTETAPLSRKPETHTMGSDMEQPQESRIEKVGLAVTPSEKRAVRAVAALRETDESNLCREVPIADIVAEYRRLQGVADVA